MKLSDIKGERTMEVIADLIVPVSNIAQDEMAKELFEKRDCPEGMTSKEFVIERIKKAAPTLLKTHRQDLIDILATIKGVSATEYAEQMNMANLLGDLLELFSDQEFIGFFTSAVSQGEPGTI